MIHLTQYIAPLQADFGPSLNDSARVLIYSGGEYVPYVLCFELVSWKVGNGVGEVCEKWIYYSRGVIRMERRRCTIPLQSVAP